MTPSEYENHQIFEKLDQIQSLTSDSKVRKEIEVERINFYDSAVKYIKDRLNLTIPILVPNTELDKIFQHLEHAISQINAYLGNKNRGHLSNADTNFNSALLNIRNLPLPFSKNDFNFAKSIANFEKIVKGKYKELENENSELKRELAGLKKDLTSKENEIKQLSELINTKTSEINNLTSTFQTEFNNLKSTANQNFSSDRKTFRSEVNSDRDAFRKEVNQDRETFRKEIDEKIKSINDDSKSTIDDLKKKLREAQRIVNVIGNIGVTGNYQNIANQHRKVANLWRVVAVIFMIILSGLLIFTIWDISSDNYDWIKSIIRIVAAVALSYPATYAAKESSKHRKLETINRRLELELASLTPFIEMLPDDKKTDIKVKLVEKYFGNYFELDVDKDSKKEELSVGGFEKILKAIIPFLKK